MKIYENEIIRFRILDDPMFIEGEIQGFSDTCILIHDTEVPISIISEIDIRGRNFDGFDTRSSAGKLIVAGLFLPLIDGVNQDFRIQSSILLISSGLLMSGIILSLIKPKKISTQGKYRMVIVRRMSTSENAISSPQIE